MSDLDELVAFTEGIRLNRKGRKRFLRYVQEIAHEAAFIRSYQLHSERFYDYFFGNTLPIGLNILYSDSQIPLEQIVLIVVLLALRIKYNHFECLEIFLRLLEFQGYTNLYTIRKYQIDPILPLTSIMSKFNTDEETEESYYDPIVSKYANEVPSIVVYSMVKSGVLISIRHFITTSFDQMKPLIVQSESILVYNDRDIYVKAKKYIGWCFTLLNQIMFYLTPEYQEHFAKSTYELLPHGNDNSIFQQKTSITLLKLLSEMSTDKEFKQKCWDTEYQVLINLLLINKQKNVIPEIEVICSQEKLNEDTVEQLSEMLPLIIDFKEVNSYSKVLYMIAQNLDKFGKLDYKTLCSQISTASHYLLFFDFIKGEIDEEIISKFEKDINNEEVIELLLKYYDYKGEIEEKSIESINNCFRHINRNNIELIKSIAFKPKLLPHLLKYIERIISKQLTYDIELICDILQIIPEIPDGFYLDKLYEDIFLSWNSCELLAIFKKYSFMPVIDLELFLEFCAPTEQLFDFLLTKKIKNISIKQIIEIDSYFTEFYDLLLSLYNQFHSIEILWKLLTIKQTPELLEELQNILCQNQQELNKIIELNNNILFDKLAYYLDLNIETPTNEYETAFYIKWSIKQKKEITLSIEEIAFNLKSPSLFVMAMTLNYILKENIKIEIDLNHLFYVANETKDRFISSILLPYLDRLEIKKYESFYLVSSEELNEYLENNQEILVYICNKTPIPELVQLIRNQEYILTSFVLMMGAPPKEGFDKLFSTYLDIIEPNDISIQTVWDRFFSPIFFPHYRTDENIKVLFKFLAKNPTKTSIIIMGINKVNCSEFKPKINGYLLYVYSAFPDLVSELTNTSFAEIVLTLCFSSIATFSPTLPKFPYSQKINMMMYSYYNDKNKLVIPIYTDNFIEELQHTEHRISRAAELLTFTFKSFQPTFGNIPRKIYLLGDKYELIGADNANDHYNVSEKLIHSDLSIRKGSFSDNEKIKVLYFMRKNETTFYDIWNNMDRYKKDIVNKKEVSINRALINKSIEWEEFSNFSQAMHYLLNNFGIDKVFNTMIKDSDFIDVFFNSKLANDKSFINNNFKMIIEAVSKANQLQICNTLSDQLERNSNLVFLIMNSNRISDETKTIFIDFLKMKPYELLANCKGLGVFLNNYINTTTGDLFDLVYSVLHPFVIKTSNMKIIPYINVVTDQIFDIAVEYCSNDFVYGLLEKNIQPEFVLKAITKIGYMEKIDYFIKKLEKIPATTIQSYGWMDNLLPSPNPQIRKFGRHLLYHLLPPNGEIHYQVTDKIVNLFLESRGKDFMNETIDIIKDYAHWYGNSSKLTLTIISYVFEKIPSKIPNYNELINLILKLPEIDVEKFVEIINEYMLKYEMMTHERKVMRKSAVKLVLLNQKAVSTLSGRTLDQSIVDLFKSSTESQIYEFIDEIFEWITPENIHLFGSIFIYFYKVNYYFQNKLQEISKWPEVRDTLFAYQFVLDLLLFVLSDQNNKNNDDFSIFTQHRTFIDTKTKENMIQIQKNVLNIAIDVLENLTRPGFTFKSSPFTNEDAQVIIKYGLVQMIDKNLVKKLLRLPYEVQELVKKSLLLLARASSSCLLFTLKAISNADMNKLVSPAWNLLICDLYHEVLGDVLFLDTQNMNLKIIGSKFIESLTATVNMKNFNYDMIHPFVELINHILNLSHENQIKRTFLGAISRMPEILKVMNINTDSKEETIEIITVFMCLMNEIVDEQGKSRLWNDELIIDLINKTDLDQPNFSSKIEFMSMFMQDEHFKDITSKIFEHLDELNSRITECPIAAQDRWDAIFNQFLLLSLDQ